VSIIVLLIVNIIILILITIITIIIDSECPSLLGSSFQGESCLVLGIGVAGQMVSTQPTVW